MKIVVVGNGMVSYKFCEKIRQKMSAQQAEIVVFGEEHFPAYDRVHLSEYFEESSVEKLLMAPVEWYRDQQIDLRTGMLVTDIDRSTKQIKTHTGLTESYDYLILATGSFPFVPKIPGTEKKGVFVYRQIEDLDQIMTFGRQVKKGTVLGGGLLGLEAAKALMDLGLDTSVVEFAPRLMPRQLDQVG
ncbi:MAG: NAD(P)/FAD-dependent oxidoreductase, partial [Cyclobacteriaceae bacterium]|nr:NAD(P)/FAD-dependent oxidoreductase [Cyclobacteriaceae bacterium HetDA_MAG_MS6]